MELALKADDLWLKAHEILQNIEVVAGEYYCIGPSILGAQKVNLMSTNCNGENDIQWKNYVNIIELMNLLLRKMFKVFYIIR